MKIVAVSDTHYAYDKLKIPKCDLFIHAGDWDAMRNIQEFNLFNKWLDTIDAKDKVVIAGNHDIFVSENSSLVKGMLNAIYLENSGCEIEGFKIWGSPITPTFNYWAFMADRGLPIRKYWEAIPLDTDILITHGPPYGIMDMILSPFFDTHVGCADLLTYVKRIKPKLHIFGHIHSGHGTEEEEGILFINASVMDEEYEVVYEPIQVKI